MEGFRIQVDKHTELFKVALEKKVQVTLEKLCSLPEEKF